MNARQLVARDLRALADRQQQELRELADRLDAEQAAEDARWTEDLVSSEEYNTRTGDTTPVVITMPTCVAVHLLHFVSIRGRELDSGTWIHDDVPTAIREAIGVWPPDA